MARGKRNKQDQDGIILSDSEPVEDPDFSGEGSSEARPGATHILIDFGLRTMPRLTLCIFTKNGRSGPGNSERAGHAFSKR